MDTREVHAQLVQSAKVSYAPARRPRFKKDLLEKEDVFIDPVKEAALLSPENTIVGSMHQQIALEMQVSRDGQKFAIDDQKAVKRMQAHELVSSFYEYLVAIFERVKKNLKGNRRVRAKVTARGKEALEQLRYLALLCDASDWRSSEEILSAEAAFGEAYFEIMSLSANLEKMSETEQAHHVEKYARHMSKVLQSAV